MWIGVLAFAMFEFTQFVARHLSRFDLDGHVTMPASYDVMLQNKFIGQAKQEMDLYPCMWLRGILPMNLVTVNPDFNP